MPIMIRPDGKAKKIAFAILGKPANLQDKRSSEQKLLDKKLLYQDTSRVR